MDELGYIDYIEGCVNFQYNNYIIMYIVEFHLGFSCHIKLLLLFFRKCGIDLCIENILCYGYCIIVLLMYIQYYGFSAWFILMHELLILI